MQRVLALLCLCLTCIGLPLAVVIHGDLQYIILCLIIGILSVLMLAIGGTEDPHVPSSALKFLADHEEVKLAARGCYLVPATGSFAVIIRGLMTFTMAGRVVDSLTMFRRLPSLRKVHGKGGILLLTNQRILFLGGLDASSGLLCSILLSDVTAIKCRRGLFVNRPMLRICTEGRSEAFVLELGVRGREQLCESLPAEVNCSWKESPSWLSDDQEG